MNLKNNPKNQILIVIAQVLLILISIGYAVLSTTLTINGSAKFGRFSWLVYFTNVVPSANNNVVQVVTEPSTTGKETTTINWAVNMDTPGQMYEFTVDIVNEGSIDAMIETETENLITNGLSANQKKYLDYTVTYINGALVGKYDKLAAGETKTIKVKLKFKTDVAAADLPKNAETIDLSYSINYVQADDNAVEKFTKVPLGIGETVNYSTTLNNVTLDNWKVFYVDGDYTYIIYGDYLPNAAIDTNQACFSQLSKNEKYAIHVRRTGLETASEKLEKRTLLINTLSTKSNWDSLLTGTLNGNKINETRSEHIYAMGSPDIELWTNSWNTLYPEDKIYIRYAENLEYQNTTYGGWYVGESENQGSSALELSGKEGYNNILYYPHKSSVSSCYGYWLASPSAGNCGSSVCIVSSGNVSNSSFNAANECARPVISLPSSIVNP